MPPGAGCLTLVTSRRRLTGLEGAHSVALEVLTPDEAVALMHRVVGERVLSDTAAAAEVGRRCEYLTLAVRLAAARLAHRPSWTVRDLAGRLAALDEIAAEGRGAGMTWEEISDTTGMPADLLPTLQEMMPNLWAKYYAEGQRKYRRPKPAPPQSAPPRCRSRTWVPVRPPPPRLPPRAAPAACR